MALSCNFELLPCEAEGKGVLDNHGSLCAATGKFSCNLAVRKHGLQVLNLVKWSATAIGMLSSAIKFENKNSAFTTPEMEINLSDQLNVLENINNKYVVFCMLKYYKII